MRNGRIIDSDGDVYWCVNGQLHREDGPAVEWTNGSCFWYINGHRHREDGPAIERADGSRLWYINGQLHCETGPAVERANGSYGWCLYGRSCSFAEWLEQLDITAEHRTLLLLKWSSHA